MKLSQKVAGVTGSLTLVIDAKAKEMKARGIDVVGFGAGEPDFNTPEHIAKAAHDAIDNGKGRYTPAAGTIEVRQAVCDKLLRRNGLSYEPDQIVVSNGAKHTIHNVLCALLDEGDEVIIQTPCWVSYPELVKMAGGVPVFVKGNGGNATAAEIERAITPNTRVIVVNTPGNPCGNVYTMDELKAIADLAVRYDLTILSDEIYEDFVYDGEPTPSIATISEEVKARTVIVNGVSKTYAMTGWRIGYCASEPALAKAMANWQSHATSNPNSIAQIAAQTALSSSQECVQNMVQEFKRRRDYMVERLNAMPYLQCEKPKGAFYVMVKIDSLFGKKHNGNVIDSSTALANMLLEDQAVALVPGIAFGDDSYVRLSYALGMENIKKGMDRMEAFLNALQ